VELLCIIGAQLGLLIEHERLAEDHAAALEAVRHSEHRYELAMEGASEGVWDWDLTSNMVYYSPRWKAILGFGGIDIGTSPDAWLQRIHPADRDRFDTSLRAHLDNTTPRFDCEHRVEHKDGGWRWVAANGEAEREGEGHVIEIAGTLRDITATKLAEQELAHGSFYDMLTGLPNRALFNEYLERSTSRAQKSRGYHFAVLLLDVDRFKLINSSLGHQVGDELLAALARRIESTLRPGDTFARFGDDDFTILLEDISEPAAALEIADNICRQFELPFSIGAHEIFTSVSIGIALSSLSTIKAENLLQQASVAMHRAKAHGRAQCELYDATSPLRPEGALQLETDLHRALIRGELRLYYQPVYSLTNRRLSGFEALVRWQHSKRGLMQPAEFIPIAEETGLIIPIGWWTLREACRQIGLWQSRFRMEPPMTISVNLSARQFAERDLVRKVSEILLDTGLPPQSLVLEITESVLMQNPDSLVDLLSQLKQLHVQLHVDDFGKGYSSLTYLQRFPIDKLKVDQSFVTRMDTEVGNVEIVRAVVNLAHSLGMGVVAEGAETEQHVSTLWELACEYAQGFFFKPPMDSATAESYLESLPR
jgi:diguanylate cyclase (GGDEF)-like protein/PAS domain S-box-containing protein